MIVNTPIKERYESHTSLSVAWIQLGAVLEPATNEAPSTSHRDDPIDVEWLLTQSAIFFEHGDTPSPPLFRACFSWLIRYGAAVAKHRLAALVAAHPRSHAAMGSWLRGVLELGGAADFAIALAACGDAPEGSAWSCEYDPAIVLPEPRVLSMNPWLRDRAIRKGDLRCSILESLRFDAPGSVPSAATLARLTGTTRAAVNKALRFLYAEGDVTIRLRDGSRRDYEVARTAWSLDEARHAREHSRP